MNTKKVAKLLLGLADSFDTNDRRKPDYRADTLRHIANEIEPQPEPAFKVGDWLTDGDVTGCVSELCGSECLWIDATDGASYHINLTNARKLKPSGVVIHIGCLSGTVEKAQDYAYFLLWHSKTDCDYSMIKWDALDIPTRELVESLLKAQEVRND